MNIVMALSYQHVVKRTRCNIEVDSEISFSTTNIISHRRTGSSYFIDYCLIKVGSEVTWLWVAINGANKINSLSKCITERKHVR